MNAVRKRFGRDLAALLVPVALGLGACTEYGVVTVLVPGGGGGRMETVRVARGGDDSIAARDYVRLMNLGEEKGWSHRAEVDDDTTHVFERERGIPDVSAWTTLTGTIRIDGATPEHARTRVGRTALGDVRFSNRVHVTRGRGATGTTYAYRETLSWQNGAAPIVEFFVGQVNDAVAREYPLLRPEQRGELTGLVRAGLWAMFDSGSLGPDTSGEEEEVVIDRFVTRTAKEAAAAVRVTYADARPAALESILRGAIEEDDELGRFLDSKLPGLSLAWNTEIELRLIMPGSVIDSNAEVVEGDTLVWKVNPGDALTTPIELRAESVVKGG